jgi:hypothetical protein
MWWIYNLDSQEIDKVTDKNNRQQQKNKLQPGWALGYPILAKKLFFSTMFIYIRNHQERLKRQLPPCRIS